MKKWVEKKMPTTKSFQPRAYRASSKMGKRREGWEKRSNMWMCHFNSQLYLWKGHVNVSKIRIIGLPPRSSWTHFANPWSDGHIIGGFQNCNESWNGMSPVHFEFVSLLRGPVRKDRICFKCPYESQIKSSIYYWGKLSVHGMLASFDSKLVYAYL